MDLFDAILLARIQFASLHQGNLERYCQLAEWRPCEDGALFPWRYPLALSLLCRGLRDRCHEPAGLDTWRCAATAQA